VPNKAVGGFLCQPLGGDAATGKEDEWIRQAYEDAVQECSQDDRIVARSYLEQHLRSSNR
jgi:hypothetical protein